MQERTLLYECKNRNPSVLSGTAIAIPPLYAHVHINAKIEDNLGICTSPFIFVLHSIVHILVSLYVMFVKRSPNLCDDPLSVLLANLT